MYGRTRRSHAASKSIWLFLLVCIVTEGIYKTNGKTRQRERKYYIPIKSQTIKNITLKGVCTKIFVDTGSVWMISYSDTIFLLTPDCYCPSTASLQ